MRILYCDWRNNRGMTLESPQVPRKGESVNLNFSAGSRVGVVSDILWYPTNDIIKRHLEYPSDHIFRDIDALVWIE